MTIEDVKAYNSELREGLKEMFEMLPKGQQKQVLKNPKVKACLLRFHIIEDEEQSKK